MIIAQLLRIISVIIESMSIRFSGGHRFQRGRGIGGLLRIAKNLFQPLVRTIGKAVNSNTGRAIGKALKEQAIESGTNLVTDVLRGNNISEGFKREVNTFKEKGAEGIEQLQKSRRNQSTKPIQKIKKVESGKYIFVNKTQNKKKKKKKCE